MNVYHKHKIHNKPYETKWILNEFNQTWRESIKMLQAHKRLSKTNEAQCILNEINEKCIKAVNMHQTHKNIVKQKEPSQYQMKSNDNQNKCVRGSKTTQQNRCKSISIKENHCKSMKATWICIISIRKHKQVMQINTNQFEWMKIIWKSLDIIWT